MTHRTTNPTKQAVLAALTVVIAAPALADQAVLTYSDDWQFDLTGYLFAPASTTGSTTVAGQTVPLDLDLKDSLDLLDFAFSGRFEAWRGNLGLIVDMNYLALEASAQPAPPITADVNVKQSWLGLLAAYRVASGTSANGNPYSVDIQGGARYNSLKQTVAISGGPGAGTTLGGTETW